MSRSPVPVMVASLALAGTVSTRAADEAAGRDLFEAKIRPVLVQHCEKCHSAAAGRPKGGLRLDARDGLRRGGESGPAIVPGKPDESLLIDRIAAEDEATRMPPKGQLPAAVVADFRRWIALGAPDPRDGKAVAAARPGDDWWSLRPIARPAPPDLDAEGRAWARTPIDAFLYEALRARGLRPSAEADRRTLIRRLTFDLTGLPPSPEEVAAFVADGRPDAYERLVDRLLASPHYGERMARRWMDLVHFAETHGHDQDRIRENAWPYRDYLIASFNADTPYARFVREQVAADALDPDEPGRAVALGMLAAGPWDESSLRDIREDSLDRQVGRYLDRDDVVATVISTFVSSTVHCARCHDHKFDPISQDDYYGLQAVFSGVDRADRPFDPDPRVHRARIDLKAKKAALERRDRALLDSLLSPRFQAEVAEWESDLKATRTTWTVLDPSELKAIEGATLTEEADHSVSSGGKASPKETYQIKAETDLRGITAVRLEVLPDDRLPVRGPGRAANGNLHLTEFQVRAARQGAPPTDARTVAIRRAVADFDQAGWVVAGAIDGNAQTAWGIYPEVGKPHEAVFELAEDVGFAGGTTLTFVLDQSYPTGHLIGRLRLSATTAPRPVRPRAIPAAVAAILAVPAAARTPEQRRDLAALYLAERLDRDLAALPKPRLVYAAASDFAPDNSHRPAGGPRPVHVLRRGEILATLREAQPGALSCVAALPSRFATSDPTDEAARRAALARWLSDPANPLTWRSIVNRAWQHHFGRGLVETPNDFGRMGAAPSHPELLDWLAAEFRDGGGSLKRFHRLIVTSAGYRQGSGLRMADGGLRQEDRDAGSSPQSAIRNSQSVDGDNHLLWRMNRTRLDAEQVRDAILMVAGRLDRTMGGPSVRQFALAPGVHVTPVVDYTKYDWDAPGSGRRAVYRFLFRTLPDPFFEAFDAADGSQLTPARGESVSPLQALALRHNAFVIRQSAHLADRVRAMAADTPGRIRAAFVLALAREPGDAERQEWSAYADRFGLENACRMLLNSNEFLYVD